MLNEKRPLPSYPDGVLEIRAAKPRETDFGARRNVKKRSDTEFICSLCYNMASLREQDYAFAERESVRLDAKARCPRLDLVTSDHMALIGDTLYDITKLDKTKDEIFLYLEEVGKIEFD